MIYLLYGTESLLIKEEIQKITKENNVENVNISQYNLEETLLKDIVEDCLTTSLFSNKKAVIVYNSYIFIRIQKKMIDQDISILEDYLNNPNPDTILIFIVNNEKLDNVKKICKLISEKGHIKDFNMPNNINNYVKKQFDDYQIDNDSVNLLIKRVGNNLNILKSEIEKLKIYKIEEKEITKKDILNLSTNTIDLNIFNFIDNIINKNKKEAINTYYEMLKLNEEPIKIIVMLANKFRLMYQACELTRRGYSLQAIADKLNSKKYPVQLAVDKGFKYNSKDLLKILNDLADLDIDIKMGLIDKNIALELFILKL